MIVDHGKVPVAYPLLRAADSIKHQNYKTNTPKRFQTQPLHGVAAIELICDLSTLICEPYERLDFVYFSVCKGAEPHVDCSIQRSSNLAHTSCPSSCLRAFRRWSPKE